MTVNDFAVLVSRKEKGKKEINIAQIKEILKVIRSIMRIKAKVDFYHIIRKI